MNTPQGCGKSVVRKSKASTKFTNGLHWISSREAMEDAAIVEHLHSAGLKIERL
jgi:hypothetical protein